ncbi:hypothetical protein [Pelagicoccus mobilis]|uniref:Uncharacterized protein n=1 Tax=Pelagicoccus mobilis TaxID=415221 RepID=A0A934S0A7_9BACT|nr:hypothetical protein [Pelagicoccus mobilis]MBK1877557.1 hypothetical protein [Pelagicoccus mobilis]
MTPRIPSSPLKIERLQTALAIALCCLLTTPPLLAKKNNGEAILRRTLQMYGYAEYYSCNVTMIEEIDIYVDRGLEETQLESESIPVNHSCSLEYNRPAHFSASWRLVDTSETPFVEGQIYTADDLYIVSNQYPQNEESREEPRQHTNLNLAIDDAEFASNRFVSIMRDFLDPAFHDDLLTNDIKHTGTRKLGKTRCHVLKLDGYKSMRVWIDTNNFALRQIEYEVNRDALLGESAWLEWKVSQAQLQLDPDERRIQRRIDRFQTIRLSRPNNYTLVFDYQNLGP